MKRKIGMLLVLVFSFSNLNYQAKSNDIPQLEDGVLSVATNCQYAPFEYTVTKENATDSSYPLQGSNGYCDGYDMQWLHLIEDMLDVKVEVTSLDFTGLIPALNSGSVDMIISAMSPTPERREQINFTDNYYDENLVMSIVTTADGPYADAKNSKDFAGADIAYGVGTSNGDILKSVDGINIAAPLEGADTLIQATLSGTVDGYFTDHEAAVKQADSNGNLIAIDITDIDIDPAYSGYAMATTKDDDSLVLAINDIIDSVSSGQSQKMLDEASSKVDGSWTDTENDSFLAKTWNLFVTNKSLYVEGIKTTLILALFGTIFGALFGFILVLMRVQVVHYKDKPIVRVIKKLVSIVAIIYIDLIRGTPMMVQAMLFFYGLAANIMEPNTAGAIIISFNTAAYIAEILRSGINSLDSGQVEAGRSLGLTNTQTFFYIVAPQTFKNTLPALANQLVLNVKDSSVLSVIAVSELFYATKQAASAGYLYTEAYFISALVYLILTVILTRLLMFIMKRIYTDKDLEAAMTLQ